MANRLSSHMIICCIFITLPFLFLQSFAHLDHPSQSQICGSTPYPTFCRSVLYNNPTANVYDYGRFSVYKSLSEARKFLQLVEKYLHRSGVKHFTATAIRALEDCKFLAELNLDFLSTSFQALDRTSRFLPLSEVDDVQTLLSAILTNTETCLEGVQATVSAWREKDGIIVPLSNNTRLYRVSLALFTKAWVPKINRSPFHPAKKHLSLRNGRLPLKMSAQNQAMYEEVSRTKLLQTRDDDGRVPVSDIVIVSKDGSGNFTSINDAVSAAPSNSSGSNGYFLIYIRQGVYEEYVSIAKHKKYLMMIGDGINKTIITGKHNVIDGWTTFRSATFAVVGQGFLAVNITFRNTAGASKHQAVAVRNGADRSTFYLCSFEGYQDTLYAHSLRQFYRECDIYGTVDFIFGNAAAVFQNCNIYPRLPMGNQFNTITAQGRTDPNQNTGISIHNCNIRAARELVSRVGSVETYLGRPWKEYSRTIYMQSFMDGLIHPSGWREWSGHFALNTSYYAEFNNRGPGSRISERVRWPGVHIISATDAANFTVSGFLLGDDWLPRTGVPYSGSLSRELN